MHFLTYTPEWFERLRTAVETSGPPSLLHRPFVDYYYTGNSWCDLQLLIDEGDAIVGTVGIERMPFVYRNRRLTLGSGNNLYAVHKGAGHGRLLFQKWMDGCDFGIAFGGSDDSHSRLFRRQKWDYYHGPEVYNLKRRPRPYPGEPAWRVAVKKMIAHIPMRSITKRLSDIASPMLNDLSVREEPNYEQDMIPKESSFDLRFSPSVEYLRWRYAIGLSFVRYRVFRILRARSETVGYVILNEANERTLVAQCDGKNAEIIAYGVLLSLAETVRGGDKNPKVVLAACHPVMKEIYRRFGFKPTGRDKPLTIGSLKRSSGIKPSTAEWLISYDWGDNGLRVPFLDQV